jgi:hypothetical protein
MARAEMASRVARRRLIEARERYDSISLLLSEGEYPPTTMTTTMSKDVDAMTEGRRGIRKRGRGDATSSRVDAGADTRRDGPSSTTSHVDVETMGDGIITDPTVPTTRDVPTNAVRVPATYASGDVSNAAHVMTTEDVALHREGFYRKILGISAMEVEEFVPNPSQANLRSRCQLTNGIYIVRHWHTGTDGLSVEAFRSMHKSWYTKLKSPKSNLGRRSGIHVRTIHPSSSDGDDDGGEDVLCRFTKDGTRSVVYLDVTQLYDALFEIHCLECDHAGGVNAMKVRVAEMYANLPEGQVKAFIDTCPVCIRKRSSN